MALLSRGALRVAATCSQGRSARNLGLQPLAREARSTTEKNVPYQRTLKEEAQGSSAVPRGPSQPLPSTADVVVIGGGSLGCQTLYHLAKLGVNQAVLLERERLTSGTTWHTAGGSLGAGGWVDTARAGGGGVSLGGATELESKDVWLGCARESGRRCLWPSG